jgi:adenine-specific DNA glycosylase
MKSILDKDFVYTNASQTDVTKIWRKYGWRSRDEILHELSDASNKNHGEILLGREDKTMEMHTLL